MRIQNFPTDLLKLIVDYETDLPIFSISSFTLECKNGFDTYGNCCCNEPFKLEKNYFTGHIYKFNKTSSKQIGIHFTVYISLHDLYSHRAKLSGTLATLQYLYKNPWNIQSECLNVRSDDIKHISLKPFIKIRKSNLLFLMQNIDRCKIIQNNIRNVGWTRRRYN